MEKIKPFEIHERKKIVRILFGVILAFEFYLFISNTLLHQLCEPAYKFLDFDITYWIFNFLSIPSFITQNHIIASIFDSTLFILTVCCFLFPLNRKLLISFYSIFFIYLVSRNTFGLFHEHLFNGVIFTVLPFLFSNNLTSKFLWEFARYVHYFIYFSAFLWKFFRGNYLEFDYFTNVFKFNQSSYIFNNPDSVFSSIYLSLFPHTTLLYIVGLAGLFLEAIYIIGFFTKKYDKFFFFLGFFSHIFFWFFADAFLFPILILNLTLLNFQSSKNN